MKIKKVLLIVIVLFIFYSCNSKTDMNYEANREQYDRTVTCLLSNYTSIFSSTEKRNPIDVYSSERINNLFCKDFLQALEKQSVSIVTFYKDSTIFFYSFKTKGLKSTQIILVFTDDIKKLNEKITSNMKIKSFKNRHWYELEKVISIAD